MGQRNFTWVLRCGFCNLDTDCIAASGWNSPLVEMQEHIMFTHEVSRDRLLKAKRDPAPPAEADYFEWWSNGDLLFSARRLRFCSSKRDPGRRRNPIKRQAS